MEYTVAKGDFDVKIPARSLELSFFWILQKKKAQIAHMWIVECVFFGLFLKRKGNFFKVPKIMHVLS